MESVYSTIVSRLASAAIVNSAAGVEFDWQAEVTKATDEYITVLKTHVLAQVQEYIESGSSEPFYLKSIANLSSDLPVSEGLYLDDHSQLVVSALRGNAARFRANHEARVKSGRVLSEKNRQRISERLKEIQAVMDDLSTLLNESQPMASPEETLAAKSTFLRLQTRTRLLGVRNEKVTGAAD